MAGFSHQVFFYYLISLLISLYHLLGNGAAIESSAPTLETPSFSLDDAPFPVGEPDRHDHIDSSRSKRDKSPTLNKILESSYREKTMLEPDGPTAEQKGRITYRRLNFGNKPWEITYCNPKANIVLLVITAKGGAIVKIPAETAKATTEGGPQLRKAKYDSFIKNPLFNAEGVITKIVKDWERDGQSSTKNWWFPDGIRMINSGPTEPSRHQAASFKYAETFHGITDGVRQRWRVDLSGKPIANIIDNNPTSDMNRVEEIETPYEVLNWESWGQAKENKNSRPAQRGFAITWQPNADGSSGTYEIWIGHKSTTKRYDDEPLERRDWGNGVEDEGFGPVCHNWGYYPKNILPMGYPLNCGPGGGCRYFRPRDDCPGALGIN